MRETRNREKLSVWIPFASIQFDRSPTPSLLHRAADIMEVRQSVLRNSLEFDRGYAGEAEER